MRILPAGRRVLGTSTPFYQILDLRGGAHFWTSTESPSSAGTHAYGWSFVGAAASARSTRRKSDAYSLRCVSDVAASTP